MLVSELKEKLQKTSGEVVIDELKIEQSGEEINFKVGYQLIGYINKGEDDREVAGVINSIGSVFTNMGSFVKIAKYIDFNLSEMMITVEKEVIREDTEKYVLQGKVEAYEKIVTGREMTVSR